MIRVISACLSAGALGSTGMGDRLGDLSLRSGPADATSGVLSALHADHEEVVGNLLSSFLPSGTFRISDGQIERVLIDKELFAPEGRVDPIDILMRQLETEDRLTAVKHFIKHNQAELLVIKKKVDSNGLIRLMAVQLQRTPLLQLLVAPLHNEVAKYIESRHNRCMYDYLPMEFRDPVKYDAMFTEGDRLTIDSYFDPLQGIFMSVATDPTLRDPDAALFGDSITGIVQVKKGMSSIFLTSKCSASLNPGFHNFKFHQGMRSLVVVEEDAALVWREDSLSPIVIPYPRDSQREYMITLDAIYFAHRPVRAEEDRPYILAQYRENLKPRFVLVIGEGATVFKVSLKLDQPAYPVNLEQREPPRDVLGKLVDRDFSGFYSWDRLFVLDLPESSTFAMCSERIRDFFQGLDFHRHLVSTSRYQGIEWMSHSAHEKLEYLFGLRHQPGPLTEKQKTFAEVADLVKVGQLYEAFLLIPSDWWSSSFTSDLALEIADEEA